MYQLRELPTTAVSANSTTDTQCQMAAPVSRHDFSHELVVNSRFTEMPTIPIKWISILVGRIVEGGIPFFVSSGAPLAGRG